MTEEEVSKLYARLALQYEAVLGTLISKHLICEDFVPGIRKDFYDTLNEDKLREFGRIKEYDSIIRRYMREMTSDESVSLTQSNTRMRLPATSYRVGCAVAIRWSFSAYGKMK